MRIECTAFIITGLSMYFFLTITRCLSEFHQGNITRKEKVIMNYDNYDKSIVAKYKVKLMGWPNNLKFANPSHIGTVDDIQMLRHSLQTGTCHWGGS